MRKTIYFIVAKLLSRANKIAYMLLNKTIASGREQSKVPLCRPGDRVALVSLPASYSDGTGLVLGCGVG